MILPRRLWPWDRQQVCSRTYTGSENNLFPLFYRVPWAVSVSPTSVTSMWWHGGAGKALLHRLGEQTTPSSRGRTWSSVVTPRDPVSPSSSWYQAKSSFLQNKTKSTNKQNSYLTKQVWPCSHILKKWLSETVTSGLHKKCVLISNLVQYNTLKSWTK